ncbi:MAG: FkbM family methyltransferase [Rubrivivax sp.]|nr:FkbM family methyltransferase [Rubrivivax sp.]
MNENNQVHNAACQALATGLKPKAVFLDVGAMGGPSSEQFKYLCRHDLVTYVGLEPQASECAALKRMFPRGIFLEDAVGNVEGEVPLHLTLSPACISVLEPNFEVLKDYPIAACFEVGGKSTVQITTIQQLVRSGKMPAPDFIKCDAQGYDYEVLEGCGDVLDTVLAIEVECQFKQIYKQQKTFAQVKELLESRGFILRDLKHQGAFEYEVVEVNAFFSKRPHLAGADLHKIKLWEFATGISSPLSFAQLKLANSASPIFRDVTPAMERTVLFQ